MPTLASNAHGCTGLQGELCAAVQHSHVKCQRLPLLPLAILSVAARDCRTRKPLQSAKLLLARSSMQRAWYMLSRRMAGLSICDVH